MDEQLADIRRFVEGQGVGPLLCLALGAPLAAIALLWVAVHWLSAPGWATVEGQLVQAQVATDTRTVSASATRNRGGGTRQQTYYRADIVYHYRVAGRDYTGFGIGDGQDWTYWSYESAAAAVARFGRGPLIVYYDPADPERSALDTNIFGLVPLIMGGVGLVLLGFGLWLRRRSRGTMADI